MLLSILVPVVTERMSQASALLSALHSQALNSEVEIIAIADNKKVPLHVKRNRLLELASGKFVAHIDDDDTVSSDFVHEVVQAAKVHPDVDVICYDQHSDLGSGRVFRVSTGLEHSNEEFHLEPDGSLPEHIKRKPWHWCAWRTEIAKKYLFEKASNEDWLWLKQVLNEAKTQHKIEKVLHYYRWNKDTTTFK